MSPNEITTPGNNPVEGGGATQQTHIQWLLKSNDSLREDLRRIDNKLDSHADTFREQAQLNGELKVHMQTILAALSKQEKSVERIESSVRGVKWVAVGAVAVAGPVLTTIWFIWGDKLGAWIKALV